MMEPYDIHPAAQNEFREIIRYYAAIDDDDPEKPLASAFDATFRRHLKTILEAPERFRFRRPPTRRVNLTPRFEAYYIAYMIWKERVVILAVAHAKRRPYYWRKRIPETKKRF